MSHLRALGWTLAWVGLGLATGCQSDPSAGHAHGDDSAARQASPATQVDPVSTGSTDSTAEAEAKAESKPIANPKGPAYAVDGMIGQVNGQAIYAQTLFKELDAILKQQGSQQSRYAFRQQATQLISERLQLIISERLLLGQAKRELSEQQEQAFRNILKEIRENLIRDHGGVESLANRYFQKNEEITLDEKLEEERRKMLISAHLRNQLGSKINISRRDIQQYYQDHLDFYQPQPGRVFRMIRVDNASDAQKVQQALADQTPFAQVASLDLNRHRAQEGGLFSKEPMQGSAIFSLKPLNQALMQLKPKTHSPQIAIEKSAGQTVYFWLYLESQTSGEKQSLRDVQLEIQALLYNQTVRRLQNNYYKELLTTGSYNPSIGQMTQTLVDVAMSRYANPL